MKKNFRRHKYCKLLIKIITTKPYLFLKYFLYQEPCPKTTRLSWVQTNPIGDKQNILRIFTRQNMAKLIKY